MARQGRFSSERREGMNMDAEASASRVRLRRDMKPSLDFEGWLLAAVSTHYEGKERWTELTLWAAESKVAMWVVEVVGRSSVEGEVDYRDATACDTLEELTAALSKNGELTAPGRALLVAATREDEDLTRMMNDDERVERL